jgi:hypothetical protein
MAEELAGADTSTRERDHRAASELGGESPDGVFHGHVRTI